MPLHIGTHYSRNITIKDAGGAVQDITGWEFRAQIRDSKDDAVLAELTTANGGIVTVDAENGLIQFVVAADVSTDFPEGRVVFDVLRTDVDPGPQWLFAGRFKVARSITRD